MPAPRRPSHVPDPAEKTLEAIAAARLGDKISVGGAFGLLHYLDYRSTHDVDAWWAESATAKDREDVVTVVQQALTPFGEVKTRSWGEVVSVDLRVEGKTTFSFQIADRSARLSPPTRLPWVDVALDALEDLIASKMVALVERGTPRDFRDIYMVCRAGMATATDCWRLWGERQMGAGSGPDRQRANLAIETHLARIRQHHPLEGIADTEQRSGAERLRRWYVEELLHA